MQEKNYNQPPPNYDKQNRVTHTFSRYPSCSQLFAYLVILYDMIAYYVCIHMINQDWILFGIYTFSVLLVFISTGIASCSDPTDPIVYHYKWALYKKQTFQEKVHNCFYCEYCESFCQENSKHCKSCNRCVYNFDHHCVWINNCIGESNYKYFIFMIVSTLSHMIIFLVSAAIMSSVENITNEENLPRAIAVWIIMVVESILGFLLLNLLLLHIYLRCLGKTTYEFMLQRRRKEQEDRQKEEQEKKQKRKAQEKVIQAEISQSKIKVRSTQEKQVESKRGIFQSEEQQKSEFEIPVRKSSKLKRSIKYFVGESNVEKPQKKINRIS